METGSFWSGIFSDGFAPTSVGADQQQASADYFRRQQEGMQNAWSGGLACPNPAMTSPILDLSPYPDDPMQYPIFSRDWLYWKWLAAMALTALWVFLLHR